jgi:hypothetical protein
LLLASNTCCLYRILATRIVSTTGEVVEATSDRRSLRCK